ncbi:MAG: NAD-dependent succinate-semialdehyde dehydrogenase [Rickettsiales bacterium]|nr:NAD-dependent succinate-semialdehyde dehydrogenase [Rickettsiales bacterium]
MKLKNQNLLRQSCFIDGKWVEKSATISVFNPSNQALIGKVPALELMDVKNAIDAAANAFSKWSKLTGKERAKILRKWYELILENHEDLAVILTSEQGKPLSEARGEVLYGANFVEWFAEEAKRIRGEVILAPKPNQKIITIQQPVGVVAAITPWNFPSAMITRKAAAAMAAGCTVVLKPSELTPFSALALAVLAKEAGVPDGVFNVCTGDAQTIGAEFCANTKIRKISFTGSTKIGKLLNQQCADDLKRISLELGGSAPFIVFADADLEKAISGLTHAKFRNGGQACTCVNRIFVEAKIHDQFVEKLLVEVKKIKVADGFDASSNMGPMISDVAVEKVERLVEGALKNGAKCEIGGKKISGQFFAPTVLSGVTPNMKIAREEIFGAVAAIQKFTSEEEVIALANDTEYGLGSYLYTNDNARIWRISDALEFGMVGINEPSFATEVAPFGGIKHSGFGREGSHLGIEEFCQLKTLHISF